VFIFAILLVVISQVISARRAAKTRRE
jgi:ABC-type antimicrobial peptide transport system permease subunit